MSDNLQQHIPDLSPWRSPRETGSIEAEGSTSPMAEMGRAFVWTLPGPALGPFLMLLSPFASGLVQSLMVMGVLYSCFWSLGSLLSALLYLIKGRWFLLLGIVLAWVFCVLGLVGGIALVLFDF